MPLIQLELSDEQDKKIEYYKIEHDLKTKADAIRALIDELNVHVAIR